MRQFWGAALRTVGRLLLSATLLLTGFGLFLLVSGQVVFASDRKTVIDFEGALVEGVNKRPLNSLSQVSEKDKKSKRPHLYRKRLGYRTEIRETLKEIRLSQ